ncbi:hypothetical protein LOTGIDRAFT_161856 [Lottia gigantea]|uniref:SMB domain-containing protein n=1 Tax=Lottia gigantea TaxID=225164 RepID=V4ADT7_LOTGI|nr:hypothetical protein LOTGIDRAFT_161856 [Lottia gigantea]ESO93290.1 hypothetical protein LOTGIDRAFT_161856 [Lottia gigantea]
MDLLQKIIHFNIFICPVVSSVLDVLHSTGGMNMCRECIHNPEKGLMTIPHCVKCYCDKGCMIYGDCCIDVAQKFHLHTSEPNPEFSCVAQNENVYRFYELHIEYGYYMTTSYQQGTNRKKCNKRIEPVTSNITGRTYSNIECAIKNNERYLIPWTLRSDQMATIIYPPDNISLRVCDYLRSIVPISNCSEGSQTDQDSCDSYYYPVYDDVGNVYQNIYCYMCNGGAVSSVKSEGYNPLRALTRFSETFSPDNKILKCIQDEEWMDTIALKCRRILCFEDAKIVNKTCPVSTIDSNMKYFIINIRLMILKGPLNIADQLWDQIIGNSFSYVSQGLHSKNYSLRVSTPSRQLYWNGWANENLKFLNVRCWFQVSQSVELFQLQRDIDKFVKVTEYIGGVDIGYSYVNNLPKNISFERFYQLDSNVDLCCIELATASPVTEDKYTFISEQLMCPYIHFESSEYVVDYLTAYIPHLNISLESNQYHVNFQQKLVVCVNDIIVKLDTEFLNNSLLYIVEEEKLEDLLSWYLNVACITSSLVCLAISFMTFLSKPELRTLPGKTNMILIASLFLAQFTLISGISIKNPT